jgi:hypothetical protein
MSPLALIDIAFGLQAEFSVKPQHCSANLVKVIWTNVSLFADPIKTQSIRRSGNGRLDKFHANISPGYSNMESASSVRVAGSITAQSHVGSLV